MKMTPEQKAQRAAERKELRRVQKLQQQEHSERNQKQVQEMYFNIEWKKSNTWGMNPHLNTWAIYKDGSVVRHQIKFTCSGSGYNKENCVLAQAFNFHLLYLLWQYHDTGATECISFSLPSKSWNFPYFGESGQYAEMFKLLGGKFVHVTNTPTYDSFCLSFREFNQ